MKKMTKAERIYEATRRECKDIITGIHGYSEGQRLSGLVTEEVVCMRTINAIMKLVDKEEHRIRLDEELGVLSGEKLQLYINVNKMVRSTVENVKKSLKKFLDDLKPDSEYSKWLDERVAAMEAQESAEAEKSETTAPETEQTEIEETVERQTVETSEQETQFDFYNVTIGFEVEKFIGTIPADYESLGIYSDYEKAVQAAQAAADEYGAENIYFHTVEIATRNDRYIYDREDYEFFVEERETIRHNWYTLTIVDTGKREHVNLDKPVRLDFEE